MGKKFPAVSFNPFHTEMSNVGLHTVVLHDDLFLPKTFFMQCTMNLLQQLVLMSSIDCKPVWQKPHKHSPFSIPKDSYHPIMG
jgi:hypothetical protein